MRFHGLFSIILAGVVIGMSLVYTAGKSLPAAAVYLTFVLAMFYVIVYAYCAKCPSRKICSHVVLGKLTRFVPERKTEPYSAADVTFMASAFVLLFGVSFIVLWPSRVLFFTALAVTAATVIEIKGFVCPSCKNVFCPIKKL